MVSGDPEFLTTRELAALLRVKERKIYELAAAGEVPCRKLTGKLLFPRAEIERWLRGDGAEPRPAARAERPNVVVCSHDPLLEWALRESGSGLAAFLDGSLDGLRRLKQGEAIAGGLHVVESDEQFNLTHVREALDGQPVVLLEWAWRDQGLIVPPGNPLGIQRLRDLRGRRFMPRQKEAGTHVLLQRLAVTEGLALDEVNLLEPPARSQTDVAAAVANGKADAGLGLACAAAQFKLAFVPLTRERYDLVVYRRAYFEPPFQRLLAFCASRLFAAHADELGGYDLSGFGTVHYNGP